MFRGHQIRGGNWGQDNYLGHLPHVPISPPLPNMLIANQNPPEGHVEQMRSGDSDIILGSGLGPAKIFSILFRVESWSRPKTVFLPIAIYNCTEFYYQTRFNGMFFFEECMDYSHFGGDT